MRHDRSSRFSRIAVNDYIGADVCTDDPQCRCSMKALLRVRAARHGHSMEAELRTILVDALRHNEDRALDLAVVIRRSFASGGGATARTVLHNLYQSGRACVWHRRAPGRLPPHGIGCRRRGDVR
jgi:plasmid stability protein